MGGGVKCTDKKAENTPQISRAVTADGPEKDGETHGPGVVGGGDQFSSRQGRKAWGNFPNEAVLSAFQRLLLTSSPERSSEVAFIHSEMKMHSALRNVFWGLADARPCHLRAVSTLSWYGS